MKLSADRILRFQNALIEALSGSASLQDLLMIAHEEFRRPMFIKGDGSTIYAITDNYDSDVHPNWPVFIRNMKSKEVDFDSVRTVSEDPEFSQVFSRKEAGILRSPYYGGMILHANVRLNNIRLCEIIALENGKPFYADDIELMNIFSRYVQLHVSIHRDRYMANADLSAAFIELLNDQSVAPMELLNMNAQMGWGVDDELAVILVDSQSRTETPILAAFRDKLKNILRDSVTFLYRNQVVSVINLTRSGGYQNISRQISKLLASETLYCGLSYEYTGIERTKEFYHLAQLACSIATRLGRKFLDMYSAAQFRISERIHAITDLQDLIHPDLIRLDHLDPQRTSHYLETLYAFLLCGGNYTDTANYLGLHRNSLIYRMNRIQGIIKSNLNDVHNKHLLLISYLIMGINF